MGVKARGLKLHLTYANSTYKLKVFSILLQTQTVHSEVSFLICTALAKPFYFLLYALRSFLKGSQKHDRF